MTSSRFTSSARFDPDSYGTPGAAGCSRLATLRAIRRMLQETHSNAASAASGASPAPLSAVSHRCSDSATRASEAVEVRSPFADASDALAARRYSAPWPEGTDFIRSSARVSAVSSARHTRESGTDSSISSRHPCLSAMRWPARLPLSTVEM